jgi:tetratricopeptide (TPR) repeat protein
MTASGIPSDSGRGVVAPGGPAGRLARLVAIVVLCLGANSVNSAPSTPAASSDCPPSYEFGSQIDYFDPDPANQQRIRGVETNHLNADVEALRQGQSASIGADLIFILRLVPNHHRALDALMRLAIRDRTARPAGVPNFPVECWLHRGVVFSPKDGRARLIYGVYLARLGRRATAISELIEAEKLMPGDINVSYNLGLLYFDEKNYARSLEYARRAYAGGYPLPGLKNKLSGAGKWHE